MDREVVWTDPAWDDVAGVADYNGVKPHASLDGMTPHEKLIEYFFPDKV